MFSDSSFPAPKYDGLWVFSYGSNSVSQLRARVENPNLIDFAASVLNYDRCFCLESKNWEGSAATIVPSDGAIVYGAVSYLSVDELTRLDGFEGGYRRQPISVKARHEQIEVIISAIAYIAVDPIFKGLPSEIYLTAIHMMLQDHYADNPEALKISIKAVFEPTGPITRISEWKPPHTSALCLQSLCIYINTKRRIKWVMPRTMRTVVDTLALHGVVSSAQFAVLLLSEEGKLHIRRLLSATAVAGFLDDEGLDLFSEALRLPAV